MSSAVTEQGEQQSSHTSCETFDGYMVFNNRLPSLCLNVRTHRVWGPRPNAVCGEVTGCSFDPFDTGTIFIPKSQMLRLRRVDVTSPGSHSHEWYHQTQKASLFPREPLPWRAGVGMMACRLWQN